MKKFLIFVLLLALAAAGAGYYLMTYRPDTPEGKWVKAQYDRFFPRPADAAPAEESAADAPDAPAESAAEAAPEAPAEQKVPAAENPADPAPPEETAEPSGPETSAPAAAPAAAPVRKPKPFSKENWYAGKKLTAADVRGKTVLVYLFDVDDARSVAMLARVQQTWAGFRHKPFTVIGSHRGARSAKVLRALKAHKVTFPVYQDAYLPCEPESIPELPYFYVAKPDGKLGFRGVSDTGATEAVVNILSDSLGK